MAYPSLQEYWPGMVQRIPQVRAVELCTVQYVTDKGKCGGLCSYPGSAILDMLTFSTLIRVDPFEA